MPQLKVFLSCNFVITGVVVVGEVSMTLVVLADIEHRLRGLSHASVVTFPSVGQKIQHVASLGLG